jgi:hypothetical protein
LQHVILFKLNHINKDYIIMNNLDKELASHIKSRINDGIVNDDNWDDLHYHCFNEDHYLIGYYACDQWIVKHFDSTFEAIDIVKDYETDHFGEMTTDINSESIANMLAYIKGEELISELELTLGGACEALETLTEYLNQ